MSQTPSEKTPTITIYRLSDYHDEALGDLAEHARFKTRNATATTQLEAAEHEYVVSVRALGRPRARVRLADLAADRGIDQMHNAAKTADGGQPGKLTASLFPDGKSAIVEPVGPTEVKELVALQNRMNASGGGFATEWSARLTAILNGYKSALEARNAARDLVAVKREIFREAKRVWIRAYKQNQSGLEEVYTDDKRRYEALFDTFRNTSTGDDDTGTDVVEPPTPAAG